MVLVTLFFYCRSGEVDGNEGAKKDRSCGPQYQSTTVRVLTHFEAEPEEWQGQPDFLLGSDWQVDVTELVRDSLRVVDERVAKLSEEQVLIGLNNGITKVQVRNRKNILYVWVFLKLTWFTLRKTTAALQQ